MRLGGMPAAAPTAAAAAGASPVSMAAVQPRRSSIATASAASGRTTSRALQGGRDVRVSSLLSGVIPSLTMCGRIDPLACRLRPSALPTASLVAPDVLANRLCSPTGCAN